MITFAAFSAQAMLGLTSCAGTEQRSGVNVWESMCADMCDYVLPLHSIHSKTSNLYIFPLMCCFVLCQVMLLLGHT